MKVKELQKTVNVTWSPEQLNSIYLAAGTAAQQLDTSPNATSTLEVYSTNLLDPGYDLELKGGQASKYRFQKLVWSPTGISTTAHPNGILVGGCEGGHIQIYSASKLLNGEDALIAHQDKHTGAVRGLDFNPFQHNLLASVASESEIFIWDLNNTTTPMAPGTKTQPLEDIQNIAWNRQVQHILASVFSSKCVIWDLRKNEQIMKLTDTQSRVRWRAIQWHPDIATQLWLASEEDQAPHVQLWDLRYATAPTKTIQIHQRGILGLTWCPKDSDLMVSCGKDNKIYCWNPNSQVPEGEILSEIATTIQWYSDVQWCPRNPALIAGSSFDGNVSIYSLFGGSQQQVQTSNKIADSFPGMDQFAQAPPPIQQTTHVTYADLKKAPKWMKKTSGISFGFGGRLLRFNQKNPQIVNICQVITEPDLIQRSISLEKTIDEGNFTEYCRQKADQMQDQSSRLLWYFIKANFEENPRAEMLNLLGYNREDISNKFDKYIKDNNQITNQVDKLTKQISVLSHGGDNNALFDAIAAGNKASEEVHAKSNMIFKIPTGESNESLICQAILTGNIEAAAEICMEFNRPAEALIIAATAGSELLHKIQKRYLNRNDTELSNIINALVTRNWIDVASHCTIDSWKEALVAALTHSEEQTSYLCDKLGERLQAELSNDLLLAKNSLLCYICAGNLEKLVDSWLLIKKSENNHDNKLSTDELQDLVEIVMLLRKSLEIRGQNLQPTGKLAEFLAQYAGLLAAQGALDSALSYLGPSQNPELEDLRERLYYALGHKRQQTLSRSSVSQPQQANLYGKQVTPANRHIQQRAGSFSNQGNIPGGFGQNNFNTGLPGAAQPATTLHPWNNVPVQQQPQLSQPWNANSMQSPQLHSYDTQQSSMPPPPLPAAAVAPPPTTAKPPTTNDGLSRPQRPSSVGSQGTTPLSRTKYVLDPSVSSAPNYGQTMSMYNPQPPQSFNPSFGQFNNISSSAPLPPVSSSIYQPTQQPANPSSVPLNPVQNNFQPFTPAPLVPTAASNSAGYCGMLPIETAQQALPPPPSAAPLHKNPTPPPGWNDPPVLKSRQPKSEAAPINPITHPIFGVDPNQGQNGFPDPNIGYSSPQFQNQGGMSSLPPPPPPSSSSASTIQNTPAMSFPPTSSTILSQQIPPPSFNPHTHASQISSDPGKIYNPMNFQTQAIPQQSQMYQTHHETPSPQNPEPIKEKPPLPEEFIYMQTVFEELKNQCQNIAPDPRTKRKFVDVTKRLETLYDALRGNKLSQSTISSLNQIVQFIQIGDYHNAMNVYMTIVSGPDFSQTASFMPGIKVLVQSASELKVYLR